MKVNQTLGHISAAVPKIQPALPQIKSAFSFNESHSGVLSLIPYYGGKSAQVSSTMPYINRVAAETNAHTYVECFGGGGRCILNLEYDFDRLIYNEWDAGLCSLFLAASDHTLASDMMTTLKKLSYSQETFDFCKKHRYDADNSTASSACMTFVLARMSFNANLRDFNKPEWNQESDAQKKFINSIGRISLAAERLKGLEVVNGDYKEMLRLYGADPRIVKYLDPPYSPPTRQKNSLNIYSNELSVQNHQEMVELLCHSRSWVLSSYDPAQYGCDDYKPLEASGATKVSIGKFHISSSRNNLYKEEFIWYKF